MCLVGGGLKHSQSPPHFSTCTSTQALSEVESEDLVQEERTRKAAVRRSRMDADLDAESADLQEKKAVSRIPLTLFSSPPPARQSPTVKMFTINFNKSTEERAARVRACNSNRSLQSGQKY